MEDDPHLELAVHRHAAGVPVDDETVRGAVCSVLRAEGCRQAELSVAFVGDSAMADLHKRHLGQPGPTDVLTFDLRPGPAAAGEPLDGEIVVSAETAARMAGTLKHSVQAELLLYVIHGLLHLLGYDDHTAQDAARMRARQHALLAALGHPIPMVETDPSEVDETRE